MCTLCVGIVTNKCKADFQLCGDQEVVHQTLQCAQVVRVLGSLLGRPGLTPEPLRCCRHAMP